MNQKKDRAISRDHFHRTMRDLLLEAPPEELRDLAEEAGLDINELAKSGQSVVERAIQQNRQGSTQPENVVVLHKGLNTLLALLRRRDGLDESKLAEEADVDEVEIRRIEAQPGFVPTPRTIFKLEKQFGLPSGVLAKLSGAVKHHSPDLEEKALAFAANSRAIGKLTREEKKMLNEFIKFLTEKG
jgi:transcriptional regulator with XRE-family HTH domain